MFFFYEELVGGQKLSLELMFLHKVINVEIKHLKILNKFFLLPDSFLILNNKIKTSDCDKNTKTIRV